MYLIAGSVSAYILTSSARVKGNIPQNQVQRTKAPCHASLKRVSKQKYVLRNRISSESVNSEESGKGITRFSGGRGGAAAGGGKSSPTEYKEGAIEIDRKSSEPPHPPTQVINNDLSTGPLVRLFFWPSVRTVRSQEEELEESYTEVEKRRKWL